MLKTAPIVQRIGQLFPKQSIQVRFLLGVLIKSKMEKFSLSLFKEGDEVFVSFDGKIAERGFVSEIHENEHVTVLLHTGCTHYLFFDEVHYTPEMAIKHQVTL